jgi:predicted 3-demethylubiquinone-9 3-methyltransferase (glyoxalase superfamily)
MGKMVPCLWFDKQAEEAAKFYVSVFKNSKILAITHYSAESSKASGMPEGSVMTVKFVLDGQEYLGLNGGPVFQHTPAISLMVHCDTQEEIDHLWNSLTKDGGQEVECGWLTDKYGISWQIVPTLIDEYLGTGDDAKTKRVMAELLKMKKLEIEPLRRAAAAG